MYINDINNEISLIIVSNERWESFSLFNSNAYPKFLNELVDSCGERLALIYYYVNLLNLEITSDRKCFLNELNKQLQNFTLKDKLEYIVYYQGITYIASLHGTLYSLKSFLDVFINLNASLITNKIEQISCHKKNINNRKLACGNFINWLRNLSHKNDNIKNLTNIIEENSKNWITQAVNYRDILAHSGEIKGFKHLRLILQKNKKNYTNEDILLPTMPDGTSVDTYCNEKILKNLIHFIKETLNLLPNINKGY